MSSRSFRQLAACGIAWAVLAVQAFAVTGYFVRKKIRNLSDAGVWAHATIDDATRRLFVARESQVDVLNVDTGEPVGAIADTKGARGVAVAAEFKRGFITNGDNATVTMFDADTLKKLADTPVGNAPDFIVYDPASKRVFSFNSVGRNATAIKAADGTVAGTIKLDGTPAIAVADGAGRLFVTLSDKGVVARVDSQKLSIDQRWPIADCDQPSSLALDQKNHRLFIGCRNVMLYVMDSENGRVITQESVGENPGATVFDPETRLIFTSSADGLISVMQQDGPDSYRIVDTLYTKAGSRTMALDLKTHRLFVPCGDLKDGPAGGKVGKKVAAKFGILVVGKERWQ